MSNGCECEIPGILWPWGDDINAAWVERCDLCKRYESDEEAADALSTHLGVENHKTAYLNYGDATNPDRRFVIVRDTRGSLQVLSHYTARRILREKAA
jgi:hypothetical protein